MRDLHSTTVDAAAQLARDAEPFDPGDTPTRAEARADEQRAPYNPETDPYRGACGGCGRPVSTLSPGGSCLWAGGAWHPACRSRDAGWRRATGRS